MPNRSTSELGNDETSDTQLTDDLGAVVHDGIEYGLSRLSLAMAETKLALVSVVWTMGLAIFCLLLTAAVWVFACLGLAYWLTESHEFSTAQSLGMLALVNLALLLSTAFAIRSFVRNLSFNESRSLVNATAVEPERKEK